MVNHKKQKSNKKSNKKTPLRSPAPPVDHDQIMALANETPGSPEVPGSALNNNVPNQPAPPGPDPGDAQVVDSNHDGQDAGTEPPAIPPDLVNELLSRIEDLEASAAKPVKAKRNKKKKEVPKKTDPDDLDEASLIRGDLKVPKVEDDCFIFDNLEESDDSLSPSDSEPSSVSETSSSSAASKRSRNRSRHRSRPSSSSSSSSSSRSRRRRSHASRSPKHRSGKKSKKNRKRDSILNRISADADKPRYEVVMTQSPPKYDHIRLESLSLKSVLRFVNQINEHQIAHGVRLPVPTLVSEKVREQLIARRKKLTRVKFYALGTKKLVKYLLEEVRPKSPLQFRIDMEKHVKFVLPNGYTPTASDFRPFYDALLILRNEFQTLYDILSEKNEDNVPPVTNKDGGLVKVFLDCISHGYGKRVYESMKDKHFHSIHDFLRPFYKTVGTHYRQFERVKLMNQHFYGTQFETPAKAASRPPYTVKKHGLNNIQEAEAKDDSDNTAEPEFPPYDDTLHSEEDPQLEEQSDTGSQASKNIEDADFLAAFNEVRSPSKAQAKVPTKPGTNLHVIAKKPERTPCFRQLFHGDCSKEGCTHSHDAADLSTAYVYYAELMRNSKYRPRGPILRKGDS
jgi:hypothetical protein